MTVWLAGLWQVLRTFNIKESLAQAIQALYENSSSAVLMNSLLGEFLKTTVGVHQGCLLSPVLFNLFPEKIMQETLHDHHTSISIGGRPICNIQFADIDLMGINSGELQDLTNRLVDIAALYGTKVSTEKSKIMTNSMNNISVDISMNSQQLEEVICFNVPGSSPVQGWHLLCRNPHRDCLSNGSSG